MITTTRELDNITFVKNLRAINTWAVDQLMVPPQVFY